MSRCLRNVISRSFLNSGTLIVIMDYYWNQPENKVGGGEGEGAAVIQSEGMGLPQYQAMPSLRDVAHDGWLCTYVQYYSSWKFHQLAAGQLLSGQPVRYGKERRYGPSITYKITPAGSLSYPARQAGSRVEPASSLQPHCCNSPPPHTCCGVRYKLCKDDFTLVS
jgi:hypothetical protein